MIIRVSIGLLPAWYYLFHSFPLRLSLHVHVVLLGVEARVEGWDGVGALVRVQVLQPVLLPLPVGLRDLGNNSRHAASGL